MEREVILRGIVQNHLVLAVDKRMIPYATNAKNQDIWPAAVLKMIEARYPGTSHQPRPCRMS